VSSDTAGLILATGIIAGAWLAVGVIFWRASEYLADRDAQRRRGQ